MLSAQYHVSPYQTRPLAMLGAEPYQQPLSSQAIIAGIGGFLLGVIFGWGLSGG